MARRLRFIPEPCLAEVTCRTVQGRYLLRPTPGLREIVVGLLARGRERYPAPGPRMTHVDRLAPMDDEILTRVFRALESHGVRYVVFGGIAVNIRGVTRATEDLDLFVDPAPGNVEAARRALEQVFGDPALSELTSETLEEYGLVRYGPPAHNFVIDITTRIGDTFSFADLEHDLVELHGQPVPVASPRMLVLMKRDSARDKDRSDVVRLRERHGIEDV